MTIPRRPVTGGGSGGKWNKFMDGLFQRQVTEEERSSEETVDNISTHSSRSVRLQQNLLLLLLNRYVATKRFLWERTQLLNM